MDSLTVTSTSIQGLFVIEPKIFTDARGSFVKVFQASLFAQYGLRTDFKESYYSASSKGVIRGMHFQLPPHDHVKLVYVPKGKITDVVLDIRLGSPTFGLFEEFELSAENGKALYLASGLAHGFESNQNDSIVTYLQTTTYSPEHDAGILYSSFGKKWHTNNPVLSERDLSFEPLKAFNTPFKY